MFYVLHKEDDTINITRGWRRWGFTDCNNCTGCNNCLTLPHALQCASSGGVKWGHPPEQYPLLKKGFWKLDKYILQFGQIHFAIYTTCQFGGLSEATQRQQYPLLKRDFTSSVPLPNGGHTMTQGRPGCYCPPTPPAKRLCKLSVCSKVKEVLKWWCQQFWIDKSVCICKICGATEQFPLRSPPYAPSSGQSSTYCEWPGACSSWRIGVGSCPNGDLAMSRAASAVPSLAL